MVARRSVLIAAAGFGASAGLLAATPALATPARESGTWRIDASRSSFSDGTFPPNMSLTIDMTLRDTRIVYSSVNDTNKDRPPMLTNWEASLDGMVGPLNESARFNQISVLRLNPMEYRVLKMKDGDVIVGEFWTFMADERTLLRRGVCKNMQGRSRAFEEYFLRIGPAAKTAGA